jgi:hypothetical protein
MAAVIPWPPSARRLKSGGYFGGTVVAATEIRYQVTN